MTALQPEKQDSHDASVHADAAGAANDAVPVAPSEKAEDGKFEIADEQRLTETVRRIVKSEMFSGPIAHPKHIEHYEKVYPGAAKIIFDQFQANAEHARRMEERSMVIQERGLDFQARDNATAFARDKRGQWIAAGLFVIGIAAALAFGYMKQPWVAGGIVTTLLVAVIGGYLTGRLPGGKSSPDEDKESSDPQEE
ncbi:hypothetical protein WJ99_13865 [Burkholderia ubonensis]|uniref:DUF2335 domain-containing protein n=1 Tax=Burkholderia ubonensis TaxID=101571 RepID=UPI00075B7ED4|nr:DUF2335 domain-containing protein [Burkholderia ubonensis]KVQ12026.1 hypothetical protein WJ99_13865 [Burkholderia ubonensis]